MVCLGPFVASIFIGFVVDPQSKQIPQAASISIAFVPIAARMWIWLVLISENLSSRVYQASGREREELAIMFELM